MKVFRYMDPEMIMTLVVTLIMLAIGVFAFFAVVGGFAGIANPNTVPSATTTDDQNGSYYAWTNNTQGNTTTLGNQIFNIVGIVIIIGAIMTIVGLVYSYVRPGGY